ncbi:hypothetical protein [Methylococcus sp. EFPC2]|uniref:hypothetical protein n=1 Tax=Methylococcus sp. EFPC2 TaxID=2812648 RepID=UPI001968537A|nr:hypothetical protein [Methylococcus sp. EFPC2]QSA97010.1 hypothetical protein JWZ97_17690 [Methylococcus sp. EFPC2]
MASAFEYDVIDELLDDELSAFAEDSGIDEGIADYARRFRRWWTIFSAARALTGTDPVTHQPVQREIPVLPAPERRPATDDRNRNRRGQGGSRMDDFDADLADLLTDYLEDTDEGESSGPCYDAFLWCMQNARRRNIPFGQSVCHACWDQCRDGAWPARVAGRMCPGPGRFRRRRRRAR